MTTSGLTDGHFDVGARLRDVDGLGSGIVRHRCEPICSKSERSGIRIVLPRTSAARTRFCLEAIGFRVHMAVVKKDRHFARGGRAESQRGADPASSLEQRPSTNGAEVPMFPCARHRSSSLRRPTSARIRWRQLPPGLPVLSRFKFFSLAKEVVKIRAGPRSAETDERAFLPQASYPHSNPVNHS